MNLNDVTVVLFDLDGTLTDYEAGCTTGLKAALNIFNGQAERTIPWDVFEEAYQAVIEAEAVWSSRSGFKVPARENRVRRFRMIFDGLGIPPGPVLTEMADAYGLGRISGTRLMTGAREVLDYLVDKYRLGVITEGAVDTQMEQLKAQKIEGYFETIVISGATPWHKPDPDLYRYAMTRLKVAPENIIMVGDRLDWDIKPAKELGMQTIFLDPKPVLIESNQASLYADTVISDLNQLKTML
ncbi:HAD-IA family hydrolase [bacterium]|nr:HAD-IA family hydrolase [candidate division CSSED10-310 bacterium]